MLSVSHTLIGSLPAAPRIAAACVAAPPPLPSLLPDQQRRKHTLSSPACYKAQPDRMLLSISAASLMARRKVHSDAASGRQRRCRCRPCAAAAAAATTACPATVRAEVNTIRQTTRKCELYSCRANNSACADCHLAQTDGRRLSEGAAVGTPRCRGGACRRAPP